MNDDYFAMYNDLQRRADALRAEEARRIGRSIRDRVSCTAKRLVAWMGNRPAPGCAAANAAPLPHG